MKSVLSDRAAAARFKCDVDYKGFHGTAIDTNCTNEHELGGDFDANYTN